MAELAENQLPGAIRSTMMRKTRESVKIPGTIDALVGLVEDSVMFFFACGIVAMGGVLWAVPVALPLWRAFLEDILALRT